MNKQAERSRGIDRKYYAVPYEQKDDFMLAAKQSGLLFGYEGDKKMFYIEVFPAADVSKFSQWIEPLDEEETAHHTTIINSFTLYLETLGLVLDGPAMMDGALHRVQVEDGKQGARDGAYVGFCDGHPAGWAQNFKTGLKSNWKFEGKIAKPENIAAAIEESKRRKQAKKEEQAREQKIALAKLTAFFAQAKTGKADNHPYLLKKGLSTCDPAVVIDDAGKLIVPIVDISGRLKSAQKITGQGVKRNTYNTSIEGNFFIAAPPGKEFRDFWQDAEKAPRIFICEGYATGLTISKAINNYVVVTFHAGNYTFVVDALQQRFHNSHIIICADNDILLKEGNKGVQYAQDAAARVNGSVVIPAFESDIKGTDFNDLFSGAGGEAEGLALVRQQIHATLQKHLSLCCDL